MPIWYHRALVQSARSCHCMSSVCLSVRPSIVSYRIIIVDQSLILVGVYTMNAGRSIASLLIAVSILLHCHAAPAAEHGLMKKARMPYYLSRRTECAVVHFPPPNQHIFCCKMEGDCHCPRRMGICAPETEAAAEESALSLSLIKRLFLFVN